MLKFLISLLVAVACVAGVIAALIAWIFASTPQPTDIRDCLTTKLFSVHLCPKDPTYVRIGDISSAAKNAVLVSEDSAFYDHHGIDWFELRQSAEKDWEKGQFARGGSTITQQLAKNVYLTADKSLIRKLREAIIAVRLEKTLKKNEILEKYLNVVEFGPNLYGIGRASRFYFNKSPAKLNAAEGAFLAFLLPNPKAYSISFRRKALSKFAHSQMRIIVDRLYRFRKISAEEHDSSVAKVDHFFGSNYEGKDYDPETPPSAEESSETGGETPEKHGPTPSTQPTDSSLPPEAPEEGETDSQAKAINEELNNFSRDDVKTPPTDDDEPKSKE